MEPARDPLDPFGLTPDTGAYVPRRATERALDALLAAVRRGPEPVALLGPAGSGKTLLLHLLAERAAPALHGIYLPNAGLAPDELCTWAVRQIGSALDVDPVQLLRAAAAHLREHDQAWMLLVDDADALPEATATWLGAFAREAAGGLRVVLAAPDGPGAGRVLAAVGAVQRLRLDEPMSLEETREYVAWRLRHTGASAATLERLGPEAIAPLHAVSGGNPRRLHLAVAALLRGGRMDLVEDQLDALRARARMHTPAPAPLAEPAPEIAAALAPAAVATPPRAEHPAIPIAPAPRAERPRATPVAAPAAPALPGPDRTPPREAAPTPPQREPTPRPRAARGVFLVALGLAVAALVALAHWNGG